MISPGEGGNTVQVNITHVNVQGVCLLCNNKIATAITFFFFYDMNNRTIKGALESAI